MSTQSMMPSNHLILCRPLLLLPSIFLSIRVFSNESALRIRWPKYWLFTFNISPCNEHPGLISFRMDWLDLLAVQGTLKSLLQHHSSKASTLRHSAFFIVQLSHAYMTSGKRALWASCNIRLNNFSEKIIYALHGSGGLAIKSCLTLETPWAVACQTPLSMGFSPGKNTGVGAISFFPVFLHDRWHIPEQILEIYMGRWIFPSSSIFILEAV